MMKKMGGFTLIELILVTSITIFVGILLISIVVQNSGVYLRESSVVNEGLWSNNTLSNLRSNLKQAIAVAASYPTSGTPIYSSSSTQLVLELPAIDSSGNIIDNTFDYMVYLKDQDKFKVKVFPDQLSSRPSMDQILASGVDKAVFEYLDSSGLVTIPSSAIKIRVTLTLIQHNGLKTVINVATTEANLRND